MKNAVQPVDDVVYILNELTGDAALQEQLAAVHFVNGGKLGDESNDGERVIPQEQSGSAFELLAPTGYEARPALIFTQLSTKSQSDRRKRVWGHLRASETAEEGVNTFGLSRADLIRNLLKERLELPMRATLKDLEPDAEVERASDVHGEEHHHLVLEPCKINNRGRAKSKTAVTLPPGRGAEDTLQKCLDEVAEESEVYEKSKRQCLGGSTPWAALMPTERDAKPVHLSLSSTQSPSLQDILGTARGRVVASLRSSLAGKGTAERDRDAEQ